MRWLRNAILLAALVAPTVLLALVWRAQLDTGRKLDALTAAVGERAAPPAPPAAPQPTPPAPAEPNPVKRPLPPYVIEAPDVLLVEAFVKDAKTGERTRLPVQSVEGAFAVRPDGTVGLGVWGSAFVAGLTTEQATAAIQKQLTKFAEKWAADALVVTVDVQSYNSKFYYVITGEQVQRLPHTGNETVLDAVSLVGGLAAGERKVWIARQASDGRPWQTLPVDWRAITQTGATATNYQLLPGDRLYVKSAAN